MTPHLAEPTVSRPRRLRCRHPAAAVLGAALAGLCQLAATGHAQVRLSLDIEGSAFLAYEPVPATLRLENFTGAPLTLDAESNPTWLALRVLDEEGLTVQPAEEKLVSPRLEIPAGRFGEVKINISRYFRVRNQGVYSVYAIVRLADGEVFRSGAAKFDITPGETFWQQRVGFTRDGVKESRTYMLLRQLRGRYMRCFLRIDDDTNSLVYGIFDLGLMVSYDQPSIRIDKDSRLWILHRIAPRSHRCSIYDPRLNTLVDRFFDSSRAAPRLMMDDDGSVEIVGGMEVLPNAPGAAPGRESPPAP